MSTTLPRPEAFTATPGRWSQAERRTGALVRVAALDDHWAVRAGLQAVIDSEPDMVLVGSAAGEDELDWLLQRTEPAILLLDVNHPGLDGLTIGLRLKRRAASPRIVLHSGRGESPLLTVAAAVAGMDAVVAKSATRRELLEAIREVAHGRSRIDVPLGSRRRAAARLDPADHAILAMRIAGSSWAEVALTLGTDDATLSRRASAIVSALTVAEPRPATPVGR